MRRQQMAQEKQTSGVTRFRLGRPWLVVLACPVVAAAALLLVLGSRRDDNVDEQLKAIDAAHVVLDGDNAAPIYTELAWDSAAPSLDPSLLPQKISSETLVRPWRSDEFPEAAKWLQERQAIIDVLLQATRKSQCWFSVSEARWQAGRRSDAARQWPLLLLRAANNDLGDGRVEAGFEKLLCTFRMANHFLAQDSPYDCQDGMGMASNALKRFGQLVITEDVPQEWLAKLEAVLPSVEDTWDEKGRQLAEVSSLHEREIRWSLSQRLVMMFTRGSSSKAMKRCYLLQVTECRGGRILLALQRHKDRTGVWPTDLAAIKPCISSETIIDPFSGKPFVYRVTGNTFLLYTVGPGGTDDGGRPPKDRVLWPR